MSTARKTHDFLDVHGAATVEVSGRTVVVATIYTPEQNDRAHSHQNASQKAHNRKVNPPNRLRSGCTGSTEDADLLDRKHLRDGGHSGVPLDARTMIPGAILMWVRPFRVPRKVLRCYRAPPELVLTLGLLLLMPAAAEAAMPIQDGKPAAREDGFVASRTSSQSGLTLDQAINLCLVNDPKLRAGFEAINQANADALTASLKPNPELFADIQLLPLTRPFTVEEQGGPPQMDVQLSYPIDWFIFGKRAAAMASARLGVLVSEAEFADLTRQRVREVAMAYHDVLEARELHALAHQDVKNLQHIAAVTQSAIKAGGRSTLEVARVRLDLVKSEQVLREAEAQLAISWSKLSALLGGQVSHPRFDLAGDLDVPLTPEPLPIERAFELADENRPDVHALRWKINKAEADTRVEKHKAFPEVSTTFGYTRQFQTRAIGFPDANSWTAAVEMSLPICDRNQGNRAKAASVVAQSNFELQSRLLELRAEIEQAIQEFSTARANALAVGREQLELAGEVRECIFRAYEAGGQPLLNVLDAQQHDREPNPAQLASLLDVLDAQRIYRETCRLYISSRANYCRALHRFNAAVGKLVAP